MLDCWMSLDVEYGVQLAEALRPYGLAWIEEMLRPEDFDGYAQLRARLPWQTLATGEHWYTPSPSSTRHRAVWWTSCSRISPGWAD